MQEKSNLDVFKSEKPTLSQEKCEGVKKQYVFLSGLPRTGSTLLSAILSQNPQIYSEGNSALAQLMWDVEKSCAVAAKEQLNANKRTHTANDIITALPGLYYKNVEEPIIIDKCRTWTLRGNIELIKKYVDSDFKIIVLERSITDVIKSFAKLFQNNNKVYDFSTVLATDTDPIMRPLTGLMYAKQENNDKNYLFINYEELVYTPKDVIERIYAFCGWEPFEHDFENIVVKHPEDDEFYGLQGFHQIRPSIGKRENNYELPDEILKQTQILDMVLGYAKFGPIS
jgi:sulfotransferase